MKKIIKDFPAYRISDDGVLETKWQWGAFYIGMDKKEIWKVMPYKYDKKGYVVVTLCDINKRRRTRLHRIVAEAFISEPPFNGAIVRHLDGNPHNNSVGNLAWGTYKQNEDDKILHGTWNTRNGGAKITQKQVLEIREKLNNGYKEKDLAIEYNVSRPTITRIKNNKIWRNV